ncbi:unnamed protein product [Heterobilharzia americana]|nr:unnamed protein product [Heterobilharzia americana]
MRRLSACRHVVSLVTVLRLQNPDRLCLVMEHCLGSVHDLQAAGVPSQTALSSENEYDRREDNFVKPSQLSYFKGKHEIQAGCEDTSKPAVTSKSSPLKFNKIRRFHTRLPMISTQVNQEEDIKISKLKSRKVSTIEHSSHRNEKNPSSPSQQQQFRRLPEAQAHAYFLQLIDGLHFLHRNGVIHRDIKPANLLLTPAPGCGLSEFGSPNGTMDLPDHNWLCSNGGQSSFCGRPLADLLAASRGWLVKLADFGVSASVSAFSSNDMVSGGQTTPAVQPPEVAKGVQSIFDGTKLDVYSAGVTLYFMLTGRVPFSCQNVLQIFEAIVKGDYTIPGHVSANASDLIRKMMHKDPKKRLTLLQIRQQTWCIQDPSPPISVEKIKMKLYNNLSSQSNDTVSRQTCTMKRRGTICWLDPLIYLRRSNAEYPPPHIDDTGARIFSIEEVFNDPTIILKHENPTDQEISSKPVNDDVVENLEDAIAPFSVIDRLKVYHDVDDYDDYSRLEDMSSFYHSPEACLQYSGLESHLANLGIVSCIESEPVSKLQSAYNAPGTSVHNDSLNYLSPGKMFHPSNSHPCCTCDQYISQQPVNSKINQHLSQDVSLLPAYEAAHPTIQGIPTPANLNNLPEPPVCPADLPISLPTSSFKLPTFTMDSSTAFRSGSLPDPVDLIPSNLDICQRMQNSVIESLNQKTWHSGSRLKHQQNLINFNGNQQLETMSKDVDQISSDFDTDGTASFFLQDNFSPTTTTIIHTSRKKKSKQLMKTVMNSQPSGGGGVQRLTRWFSNPFNVFRNRIKSLRNKDLSISNHPLPTSSIHQHRTVNSASELASVIEKYPIEEVIQSTDSLPIANCVPKPTSRIFSSKKFSFKK